MRWGHDFQKQVEAADARVEEARRARDRLLFERMRECDHPLIYLRGTVNAPPHHASHR